MDNKTFYHKKWTGMISDVKPAVDDLIEVMEWLRSEERYEQSDRLRTIVGRLARSLPGPVFYYKPGSEPNHIRARRFK